MSVHYTLRQLKTFMEVARLESVSRAAERLHVTQPAISMQIKQLEDNFGLTLFEPSGRNIVLTPAGRDFMAYTQTAFAALKDLESAIAEHAGARRGRIDLAVVSTAKYFVPMLLVQFGKLHPQITIKLYVKNKETVFGMMERSEVDLVISGRVPEGINAKAHAFASNPQGFISAPEHALSRRKNIQFKTLAHYPFVVREPGSGTRAALERLFSEHEVKLNMHMEMPSNETIKQAVMAGMGIGFLSLRTLRHELASRHLALLNVIDMPLIGSWQVAHLRSKKLSPAVEVFKQFLLSQGSDLIEAWA